MCVCLKGEKNSPWIALQSFICYASLLSKLQLFNANFTEAISIYRALFH